MIGKTNVGGGGSNFIAYIAVSTDPNAQISAVNLAGDVYTGTASASGSLLLPVRNPGTYTVSETGAGTATVVVSDYGAAYSVSLYLFVGNIISDGEIVVNGGMFTEGYPYYNYNGVAPSITGSSREQGYDCIITAMPSSGSGFWITNNAFDISEYNSLFLRASTQHEQLVIGVSETEEEVITLASFANSNMSEIEASLENLVKTRKYKIGFWLRYPSYTTIKVNELHFF